MKQYFGGDHFTRDEFMQEPLLLNRRYTELPDVLLDGFINYPTILSAFLIDDRNPLNEPGDSLNPISLRVGGVWKEIEVKSKKEALELLFKDNCDGVCHPEIHHLQDEVFILAEYQGVYWYFDYGFTGHDCELGRFKATDSKEVVMHVFKEHVAQIYNERMRRSRHPKLAPTEVPLQFFQRGWISW
jgi:hypothetical protein